MNIFKRIKSLILFSEKAAPELLYVIKGEIREEVKWGNLNEIRKGALHYNPKEEIMVNRNRKNFEDASFENRISVVGLGKDGRGYKHNKIHFKYIENLRIHELKNPSNRTLEFIEKVGLFSFVYGTKESDEAKTIIELYKEFLNKT